MKRKTWRKYHKWVGIIITFFLIMFCLSGIILNHRQTFADINVSRALLPSHYSFEQWNNGLLRGTLCYNDAENHNLSCIPELLKFVHRHQSPPHNSPMLSLLKVMWWIDIC